MNYLEFKRQLMVDPRERNAEFEAAVRSDEKCAAAAAQSDKFETALLEAMNVNVPEDIVMLAQRQAWKKPSAIQKVTKWMPAMAAGLALGIGLTTAVFFYNNNQATDVHDYLVAHWAKDGLSALQVAGEEPANASDVRAVLANLSLDADAELVDSIMHATNCMTPNGQGVHLVMHTDDGMVTVIYMPGVRAEDGRTDTVGDHEVMLTRLEYGSVAYFGDTKKSLKSADVMVDEHLTESKIIDT